MHRRLLAAGLVTVVVSGVASLPAVDASANPSRAKPTRVSPASVGRHYAIAKRDCREAAPGHVACQAVRRVVVAKTTKGARPYVVPAGLAVGPAGGLTPALLAKAYSFDPNRPARSQLVAIVDAYDDPNIAADLATFDRHYHLRNEWPGSFRKVSQTGSTTVFPPVDRSGWSAEESLDVEAVRAVCHTCRILLVEAHDTSNGNLVAAVRTAVRLGATEISNSYGGPEQLGRYKNAAYKAHIAATLAGDYNHPGVVITAATGDDGWRSWDVVNEGYRAAASPNFPASLPDVVGVGGTTLSLDPKTGRRVAERVWNRNGSYDYVGAAQGAAGSTGGGCSTGYLARGWQLNIKDYAKTGCGNARSATDISIDGDPNSGFDVYDSYECGTQCPPAGWTTVGGTSLSSPLIAAMWALAGGSHGVAYPAMTLYGHANVNPRRFLDVTRGGNGFCDADPLCAEDVTDYYNGTIRNPNRIVVRGEYAGRTDCAFTQTGKPIADHLQCDAAKGFDGPSGLGTPRGLAAFAPLRFHVGFRITTPVNAKTPVTFTANKMRDPVPGARAVYYRWIWGDGSPRTSAWRTATAHTFKTPGTYPVELIAHDQYGNIAQGTVEVVVPKSRI